MDDRTPHFVFKAKTRHPMEKTLSAVCKCELVLSVRTLVSGSDAPKSI